MTRQNKLTAPDSWKDIATLTMVVEFESADGIHQQCDEIIEKAREYGWPRIATLEIKGPTKEELV